MSAAPTPRQLDAMLSVYHGHSPYAQPGTNGRYSVRHMGGAARRMVDRIAEAGWFGSYYTRHGRLVVQFELTVAGLHALAVKHPDLEGFAEKLAAAQAKADEIAAEEAAERQRAEDAREARAIERRAARIAAMREIAQDYQVRLDLSDDQCLAMWMAIVGREHSL